MIVRTAVTVFATAAATLAAVHLFDRFEKPSAPVRQDLLLERLDRLEESLTRVVAAKAPERMPTASVPPSATPPANAVEKEKRESALRAGNAVIEQIVSAGQFSVEDDVTLTAAIAELSGDDQVAVMSRLSMAINEGRVQVRRPGQ